MVSVAQILPLLQPFKNKRDVLLHDQDVSDIITGILATHNRYKSEYNKIAVSFIGFNQRETARNIWNFIKSNVRYKVEPETTQFLKSPAAIVTPGTTSDCKNFALFTGGVLDALNRNGARIDWCYRFSSYRLFDKIPGHVFVVINPGTNKEIWVDAVLPTFDNKKSYYYKIDKKPNNMSLISLAGMELGAAKKKAKAAKKTPEAKKEDRKKFFGKLKDNVKKAGNVVIKYNPATVTSRNAFLLLCKLNVRSMATNLQRLLNKGDQKVFNFWRSIGGNVDVLKKNIEEGAKKKRLGAVMMTKGTMLKTNPATGFKAPALIKAFSPAIVQEVKNMPLPAPTQPASGGSYPGYEDSADFETEQTEESEDQSGDNIGVIDPVTQTAAAIAAAMPIVLKITEILKQHKDVLTTAADITGIIADVKDATKAEAGAVADAIDKEADGIQTVKGSQIVKNDEAIKETKETGIKSKFPIMPVALIGGGLLAFMLLKKK